MKILHLLQSSHFSGAENVACQIIKGVEEEYECAYASKSGSIGEKLKCLNINYYPMKKFNILSLNKIIDEYKPDIIHAHDFTASVVASKSKFKGKIISHIHNNPPFIKSWNLKSITYYLTLNKYYKIIGVSECIANEAIFKKKMIPKFTRVYNYVEENRIKNLSDQNDDNKTCSYDLAFIGRLVTQKNPLEFIEIVRNIKKEKEDIQAVIIGMGPLYNECLDIVKTYNLEKNIQFMGFVDNPYCILKNTKVVIMPSKWEGFGLTAIESLILKKPVLNSGVGGLNEIFEKDKYFICKSNQEYSLKIKEILKLDKIFNYEKIYSKYTNKELWVEQIIKQYK